MVRKKISIYREKIEKSSKKPEPPMWLADAPDAVGHPNSADIEALNYQLAELISKGAI